MQKLVDFQCILILQQFKILNQFARHVTNNEGRSQELSSGVSSPSSLLSVPFSCVLLFFLFRSL